MVSNRVANHSYIVSEARLGVARNLTDREIGELLPGSCEPLADLYSSYAINRGPDGELIIVTDGDTQ